MHTIEIVLATHTGLVRQSNQDYIKGDTDLGIAILADGMGGHRGGEVASRHAVETAFSELAESQREPQSDAVQSQMWIGQALEVANRVLYDMSRSRRDLSGMGTTLIATIFRERQIFFGHVGDSRLYRLRHGRLQRMTRDHSLIQRLIDDGIFASPAEAREAGIGDNILTRSLGMHQSADIDLGVEALEPGDTFLICSDGLHGCVTDHEIATILRDPGSNLDRQVIALIDKAIDRGGPDNVSVVLAKPRIS
ncbi:MAG: serine/threonine-protein phosphatase [Gammaproteobacteria bacterium]|nr:serine/threonine-protein phosphatase [Gammaproteobacteria bacterium]